MRKPHGAPHHAAQCVDKPHPCHSEEYPQGHLLRGAHWLAMTGFFDSLSRMALRTMRLMAHGSRSSLSRCMSRYALGRPGAIRGNRFSVSDVGWML